MVVVTLFGTVGVVFRPFWGVAVYYLFADAQASISLEMGPAAGAGSGRAAWPSRPSLAAFAASHEHHPLRTPRG